MKHEFEHVKIGGGFNAVFCANCMLIIAAIPNFDGLNPGDSVFIEEHNVIIYNGSDLPDSVINSLVKKHNAKCK